MVTRPVKHGFSLIEATIVLAVVGLVIGGIWTAAAAVYENYKVNKTMEGVFFAAQNVQKSVSKNDSSYMGSGQNLRGFAKAVKIFPDDWTYGANQVVSWEGFHTPYGGSVTITSFPPGLSWDGFRLMFFRVPNSICVKMLSKSSFNLRKKTFALKDIQVDNSDGGAWPEFGGGSSISLSQAQAACMSSSSNNTVYFTFDYTRTN